MHNVKCEGLHGAKLLKAIREDIQEAFKSSPDIKWSIRNEKAGYETVFYFSLMSADVTEEEISKVLARDEVNYYAINEYYINEDPYLSPRLKEIFEKVIRILMEYYWDDSDSQSDYFCRRFYYNLEIGRWDKKFQIKKG